MVMHKKNIDSDIFLMSVQVLHLQNTTINYKQEIKQNVYYF